MNTIEFVVRNTDYLPAGGPSGIRVEMTGTADTPVIPPVPEPGTWAMMIGGFGLVGASLRRRRNARLTFKPA